MRGPDKAYWDPKNPGYYRVPPGFVRRDEAWRMFGVDKQTWKRWERQGQITCAHRANRGAPKLYKLEDLQRLLEEYGRYSPPYPDPERPGCYRVPLSGWDVRRREAIIDAESLPLVQGQRWCWTGLKGADTGYVGLSLQQDHTPLHRIILGVTDRDLHVMHLNGDALDCRRENLIARTISQQMVAARKPSTYRGRPCTSRFKGVCWSKCKGKWVAQIKFNRKNKIIGRFDDEIAAAQARDEAALEMFGEHARLNFPDGVDAWLEEQQQQNEAARAQAA
jgi:transposase